MTNMDNHTHLSLKQAEEIMMEIIDNNKKNLRVSQPQFDGIALYERQLRNKVTERFKELGGSDEQK